MSNLARIMRKAEELEKNSPPCYKQDIDKVAALDAREQQEARDIHPELFRRYIEPIAHPVGYWTRTTRNTNPADYQSSPTECTGLTDLTPDFRVESRPCIRPTPDCYEPRYRLRRLWNDFQERRNNEV